MIDWKLSKIQSKGHVLGDEIKRQFPTIASLENQHTFKSENFTFVDA
jgi:hypothetical protein